MKLIFVFRIMILRTAATRSQTGLDSILLFTRSLLRHSVFVILKIKTYGFTYVMSVVVRATFKLDLLVRPIKVQSDVGGTIEYETN